MECSAAVLIRNVLNSRSTAVITYLFNSTKVFEAEFKLTNSIRVILIMNRCNLQVAM